MITTVNSSIRKSVRIPSDLIEYVEDQEGKDFTEKLINLLYEVKDGEKKRKKFLADYDHLIEMKQKELKDLNRQVNVAAPLVERLSIFTTLALKSDIIK